MQQRTSAGNAAIDRLFCTIGGVKAFTSFTRMTPEQLDSVRSLEQVLDRVLRTKNRDLHLRTLSLCLAGFADEDADEPLTESCFSQYQFYSAYAHELVYFPDKFDFLLNCVLHGVCLVRLPSLFVTMLAAILDTGAGSGGLPLRALNAAPLSEGLQDLLRATNALPLIDDARLRGGRVGGDGDADFALSTPDATPGAAVTAAKLLRSSSSVLTTPTTVGVTSSGRTAGAPNITTTRLTTHRGVIQSALLQPTTGEFSYIATNIPADVLDQHMAAELDEEARVAAFCPRAQWVPRRLLPNGVSVGGHPKRWEGDDGMTSSRPS
jgi:hypothetical protein